MTIEKILNGTRKRTLFDSFADEAKRKTTEQKLTILASLNYYGLLDKTIKDYKNYYSDRKDILSFLKPTLLYYYSELTSNKEKLIISKKSEKSILKELKKQLSLKIEPKYSIDTYIESFLNNKEQITKQQKSFFRIDLKEDITKIIQERDERENKSKEESYLELYKFLNNNLLPDYRNSNLNGYMVDMGMNYQVEYLVKHFFQKEQLRKNDYFEAIKYAFKILYFEKEPYHNFFLVRVNFDEQKTISELYQDNEIAIHFNTNKDFEDFTKLTNKETPKQQYVNRWGKILEEIENNDVIIIASYKGIGFKFGLIRKGTQQTKKGNKTDFILKLPFSNEKIINLDHNPTVQTIIPSNVTISRVKKKNYKLRKEFYNMIVSLSKYEFDDNSYEVIVNEWLRSKYAPEKYKIKYQLLRIGGNKKDIDIYALTTKGEKLIVQVSDTNDKKTIQKKINKLENYDGFLKLFFFNIEKNSETNEIISLNRVINDFKNDKEYKELLKEI